MTAPISNNLYTVANALTSSSPFIDVITNRDPTSNDNNYQLQKKWFNTTSGDLWYLASFTPTNNFLLANWVLITNTVSPLEKLEGNTGGAVAPDGSSIIHTIGDEVGIQVAGNPGTHTLTWSLVGGGVALQKVEVDTFTAPGTNPVLPSASGQITVTGSQIPAGTTGNVIQTDSLAANTYTIQVQRSKAVASSTIADNGVCHFNSANFTVDANGFVSSTNLVNQIVRQVFTTSGTYTPTTGMIYCDIEVLGGGGGSGGCANPGANAFAASGGGGGGGYAKKVVSAATIGASQTVTVGAGGTAGASGGNVGGTGGTSSVGVIISATGGVGGGAGITAGGNFAVIEGGAGGSGSGGDFNTTGNPGGSSFANYTGPSIVCTFPGGSTFFGGGAPGSTFPAPGNTFAAVAGVSYGGGASGGGIGANVASIAGAAGYAGIVIITEYIG